MNIISQEEKELGFTHMLPDSVPEKQIPRYYQRKLWYIEGEKNSQLISTKCNEIN